MVPTERDKHSQAIELTATFRILFSSCCPLMQKKTQENINSRLTLVMKSGKFTLGYKSTLKSLRSGKCRSTQSHCCSHCGIFSVLSIPLLLCRKLKNQPFCCYPSLLYLLSAIDT